MFLRSRMINTFNAYLLNKSIHLKKKKIIILTQNIWRVAKSLENLKINVQFLTVCYNVMYKLDASQEPFYV